MFQLLRQQSCPSTRTGLPIHVDNCLYFCILCHWGREEELTPISWSSSSEGFSFLTKCNHLFCRPSGQVEGTECLRAKSLQSRPNLCNPKECSPPGFSIHGILQARILEGAAVPSSRGSPLPRDQMPLWCLLHWQAGSLPLVPPGNPGTEKSCLNLSQESRELSGATLFTQTSTQQGPQLSLAICRRLERV